MLDCAAVHDQDFWLQCMLTTPRVARMSVPHMFLLHTSTTMPPVVKALGQCLPSLSVCEKGLVLEKNKRVEKLFLV
jgi:hypothetical protein